MHREGYQLRRVESAADWAAYHDIRRRALFVVHLPDVVYDESHPDETRPGNHPLLLWWAGEALGTIRIDLLDSGRAALRLIAIRPDQQRRGHGSVLLALAESFVLARGGHEIVLNAARPALAFYLRHGYADGPWRDVVVPMHDTVRMGKRLREPVPALSYYDAGLAVDAYDPLLSARPETAFAGDVAFYIDCARRFGGPVLELGAGTGRVTWPLAASGVDVVGLDLSAAMLARADARCRDMPAEARARVALHCGDMTAFELGRTFPLAIIPARAFQHLVDPGQQQAALACIHRHLAPGGHLVLHLFDPRLDLLVPGAPPEPDVEADDAGSSRRFRRQTLLRHSDPLRQTFSETIRIEEIDAEGAVIGQEEVGWTLRWTLRQEMIYLLERAGFTVVEQFSDFHGSPPAHGREQVWIARRS